MPQATDELRNEFPGGDSEALGVLRERCHIVRGVIRPKSREDLVAMTSREWMAVNYLVSEWDYAWAGHIATLCTAALACDTEPGRHTDG